MPYKDPNRKKEYMKRYYQEKKAKKQDLEHRERQELNSLLTQLHMAGKLKLEERTRLDELQEKYKNSVDSDMSLYEVENRVVGGSEIQRQLIRSDSEPPLIPLGKKRRLYGLQYGEGGTECDPDGVPIPEPEEEDKGRHWGHIVHGSI